MKQEQYISMLSYVRERTWLFRAVTAGGRILSLISYVWYPLMVWALFYTGQPDAWKGIVVPGAGFVILSFFRRWMNAPRPYEVFDTPPLITKNTRGNSFPSRHVFSAFIIAFTTAWYWQSAGFVLAVCGTLLAVTRVLSGVHFIKDVAAGTAAGIGLGLAGFLLL